MFACFKSLQIYDSLPHIVCDIDLLKKPGHTSDRWPKSLDLSAAFIPMLFNSYFLLPAFPSKLEEGAKTSPRFEFNVLTHVCHLIMLCLLWLPIGVEFDFKIVLYSHATKQELTDYRSGIGNEESELCSEKHRSTQVLMVMPNEQ